MPFNMFFNDHSYLEGKHAYLSPSSYHWLNYDEEKFDRVFTNLLRKERGTKLHALACECIKLGVPLPNTKETLNMYVNDAILFGMKPEVILYYSENCFGTADTIGYSNGLLRIHDLKTGDTKAYMHQLRIYTALFFLEYGNHISLTDTAIELRIYQHNDIQLEEPTKESIVDIMDSIVEKDRRITLLKGEL